VAYTLEAIIALGFDSLRLERIWLDVFDFNTGARRVYERVGFEHEGVQRHAIFRDGQFFDDHRMAILSGEWRAGQSPNRNAIPEEELTS
jgi:RimJ/RimL family protein N-acetyltransferase